MPLPFVAWAAGAVVAAGVAYALSSDDSSDNRSSSSTNRDEEERRARERERENQKNSIKSDIASFKRNAEYNIQQKYGTLISFYDEKVSLHSNPLQEKMDKLAKEHNEITLLIEDLKNAKIS